MTAERFQTPTLRTLRDLALTLPEVDEGDSCVKRAFRVRKKGFLYLGEKPGEYNVMLTLEGPALDEARGLAAGRDARDVGSAGWVTLRFAPPELPPEGLLDRWIEESYRRQAPKTLIALLDAR